MLSFASAFDFDNAKHYDTETREVIIKNCNLWVGVCLIEGDTIGKAKLNTPLNMKVGLGYQKVAEFDLWAYQDYNDIIKNIDLYDKNEKDWNKHKLERDFDLRYKTYRDVKINDYKLNCVKNKDETNKTQVCNYEIVGNHIEQEEYWEKVTSAILKKNDVVTVGLFTEVKYGDKIEWIPSIYGVEVNEWASWTASLDVGLLGYYKFEETSGIVVDSFGLYNGTNNGSTRGVGGIIDNAFDFDGTNDYVNVDDVLGDIWGTNTVSISLWFNSDVFNSSTYGFLGSTKTGGAGGLWVFYDSSGENLVFSKIATAGSLVYNVPLSNSTWYHLVVVANNTGMTIFLNGTNVASNTDTTNITDSETENCAIGAEYISDDTQSNFFNGKIDEIAIYNRSLTPTEVTQLYNNGSGITYIPTSFAPTITLNSPTVNANYTTPQTIIFNFTAYDELELSNVTFYVNDVLNQTNSSGINNTDYLFEISLTDGTYVIYGKATDNESKETKSNNITIFIDTILPVFNLVNITTPIIYNYGDNISIDFNVSDTNLDTCLYNYNTTNITFACTTNVKQEINITSESGFTNITFYVNDTIGNSNSTTVSFTYDVIAPTITVESPIGTLGQVYVGENETLNVTFTDSNLDSCWYNYNGTNITISGCVSGIKNSTIFILENDNKNITVYGNDTFGNFNSEFIDWSYNLTEITQTYPSTSVESATETYTASLNYNSTFFSIITGELMINGTTYSGTRTGSGDSAIFTTEAIMPSVTTETNFTTYWTIGLIDASGTINYNLTSHNVTVSIINLSLCDANNNIPFWNYTILNESNSAEINSTFEATFTVKQTGSTATNDFTFSDSTGNNSQYDFCISPSTESYTIDTDIKITKSGFVDKFYNYADVVVTNSTREDNLYMMDTEDSTSFIIHVVDVSGTNLEEAEVRVMRYYPGTNEWLTTEIVTTNYIGEAIGHLLSEDADYKFEVYLSGVSTYNSTKTKITCATTPCTVTLVIAINVDTGYEIVENLDSTLTYSSTTNVFTYTYSDTSGIFNLARLYVLKVFPSNATLVVPCNVSKSDTSGVITCDISGQVNGTYRADGHITRSNVEFLDRRLYGVIGTNIYNSMGLDGVLWGFFVFIGIIMIGVKRPSLSIIFGVGGLIILSILQIINIGVLSIVAVSAIAIILLMRIGRE